VPLLKIFKSPRRSPPGVPTVR